MLARKKMAAVLNSVNVFMLALTLYFCQTCSLCRVELVVHPRGVRLKFYYAFSLVCCDCDTSFIVSSHIQCQAFIYTHCCVEGIHG